MTNNETLFHAFLNQHDDMMWKRVITELLPSIHPVDQAATRIWFSFFPLRLLRALQNSSDPERTAGELLLSGKYRLEDQVDISANFLYGHRYWPEVKRALLEYAAAATAPASLSLSQQINEVAGRAAERAKADRALLVGITAVAFMTLQQVGYEAFRESTPSAHLAGKSPKSPEQILQDRAKDDRPGLLGFLKTVNHEFTVTFSEDEPGCSFKLVSNQDLATAAATDTRDYKARDPRCIEGPIPVECRSAACGTCWVGVLSDTRKLAAPGDREIERMAAFGYSGFTPDQNSIIRLACQTRGLGNVTIVIPPWNGQLGKLH
jgi:ferredoxin